MGVRNIALFDDDNVDELNLATQFHKMESLGHPKVVAVGKLVAELSDDTSVIQIGDRVHDQTVLPFDMIISAVDSINARQDIWNAVLESRAKWYLEARMAAEAFQLHAVNLADQTDWAWYDKYIMSQREEDVPEEVCTAKATIYTALIAAGFIGKTVKEIVTGVTPPKKLVVDILNNEIITME